MRYLKFLKFIRTVIQSPIFKNRFSAQHHITFTKAFYSKNNKGKICTIKQHYCFIYSIDAGELQII